MKPGISKGGISGPGTMGAKAPSIPAMTSNGAQHPVMRTNTHPANVIVRHPATVGPNMMAPRPDHLEIPSGSTPKSTPPGGIIGGLAPFQNAKGAEMNDFQVGGN